MTYSGSYASGISLISVLLSQLVGDALSRRHYELLVDRRGHTVDCSGEQMTYLLRQCGITCIACMLSPEEIGERLDNLTGTGRIALYEIEYGGDRRLRRWAMWHEIGDWGNVAGACLHGQDEVPAAPRLHDLATGHYVEVTMPEGARHPLLGPDSIATLEGLIHMRRTTLGKTENMS